MVSALGRKLGRDLWRLRAQVLTIALVVACGVASLFSMRSAYDSVRGERDRWYGSARFPEVFASVRRAPRSLASRIASLPGVSLAEARIVEEVTLDMPGMAEPVGAHAVSLPPGRRALLGEVFLREGRLPASGRSDEVLVHEAFARAWALRPGDALVAVLHGRRQRFRVSGVALAPEFVSVMQPGALVPDDRRYGVLWVPEDALAAAFQMEGAFNDVGVRLDRGAREAAVIAALDALLAPYGTTGAYGRSRHPSARMVDQKLTQLRGQATVTPMMFLGVAALLVNMVLARLLGLEREQIATLKALGYGDGAILRHYLAHALLTAVLGAALGVALGTVAGRGLVALYKDYFRFPALTFRPSAETLAYGVLASVGAAVAGAFGAVRAAVRVPPAEAMRPEPPPRFRPSWLERMGVHRMLPTVARMVLRELERRPGRAALSALGIAFAAAIIVAGRSSLDSLDVVLAVQFGRAQSDDVTVSFARPVAQRARFDVARLPGVLFAEPQRMAGVRLRHGVRVRDAAILGVPAGAVLRAVVDARSVRWEPPAEGLLLGRALGDRLGVRPGDTVTVEDVEGATAPREVAVAGLVDDLLGLNAYMRLDALDRLRGDGGRVTAVAVRLDPALAERFLARVKRLPGVASTSRRMAVIDFFRHETSRMSATLTLVLAAFAGIIAVGVVYNNARIALAVRSRELATLRVLGFTEAEVATVLFGEQAVVLALAIPVGLALGKGLAWMVFQGVDAELYRLPVVVSTATYGLAAGTVLAASVASAWVVRRRIGALDMVAVLKARD